MLIPSAGVHAARRSAPVLALFCFLAGAVGAEEGTAIPAPSQQGKSSLTVDGQLPRLFEYVSDGRIKPRMLAQADSAEAPAELPREPKPLKSPGRALLYSAILPGLGEFYAGARKRAALFFGLEAAAWGLYFSWNGKGKDIEEDFRAVADEQWDVLRYVDWRGATISRNSSITHALPCSTFVVGGEGISGCPETEKQQYYELIGKYDQFVFGWKDVRGVGFETGNGEVVSSRRIDYENRRNESNKLLKRASVIIGLTVVNRIASSIHAAFRTRSLRITVFPAPERAEVAVRLAF